MDDQDYDDITAEVHAEAVNELLEILRSTYECMCGS